MRYFIDLSYKGTNYNGWQVQDNAPSVQAAVQKALSTRLREPITIVGAGRTDTGVHALHYTAHFDCVNVIDNPNDTLYHLNQILPKDIVIKTIRHVRGSAHARFHAVEREYRYFISPVKDPFGWKTSWQLYSPLDIDRMNEAARWLLEFDDFTSFAKLGSDNKTNICNVTHARWEAADICDSVGKRIVFTIRSDRFLRNMVRTVTGTLVDVGRGVMTPERFREIIAARDLSLSSTSAPAQGLFLSDVKYPDDIFFD